MLIQVVECHRFDKTQTAHSSTEWVNHDKQAPEIDSPFIHFAIAFLKLERHYPPMSQSEQDDEFELPEEQDEGLVDKIKNALNLK